MLVTLAGPGNGNIAALLNGNINAPLLPNEDHHLPAMEAIRERIYPLGEILAACLMNNFFFQGCRLITYLATSGALGCGLYVAARAIVRNSNEDVDSIGDDYDLDSTGDSDHFFHASLVGFFIPISLFICGFFFYPKILNSFGNGRNETYTMA